jgi:hypothetical protein
MTDSTPTVPSGRDAAGKFVRGNREGASGARPWDRRPLARGELRFRARVERALEVAGLGRRAAAARARRAVVAQRVVRWGLGLRPDELTSTIAAQLDAAAELLERLEAECAGGPSPARRRAPRGDGSFLSGVYAPGHDVGDEGARP